MSTTLSAEKPKFCLLERVQPFLAPYYLVIAAVLGAITAGFVALTVVLILVATNFNLLGLIE
jgi:hypothetical protein